MWEVAETLNGNWLEYWESFHDKPLAKLVCDGTVDDLEKLKQLLNDLKAEPEFVGME